jgi:hypothetical protein
MRNPSGIPEFYSGSINYLNPSTEFGDFLSVISDLPAILFVGCGPLRPPESRLRPPP